MKSESTLLDLPNGIIKFRATSVKSYYDLADDGTDTNTDDQSISNATNFSNETVHFDPFEDAADRILENSPDNQPELAASIGPIIRDRGRPRKHPNEVELIFFSICFIFNASEPASESIDLVDSIDLSTQKLAESVANFNLFSYTAFRQKEISKLLEKGIFKFISHAEIFSDARIFNSRFVDEMKNADTEKTYEKSRLMMQTYNDQIKGLVLTQSPIIQRISQRLIICFASIFSGKLYLRNVTQTYVQSNTALNRNFYIKPSMKLAKLLNAKKNCIFQIMKPLYDVLEAGNH